MENHVKGHGKRFTAVVRMTGPGLEAAAVVLFLCPAAGWAQTPGPEDSYRYGPNMMWGGGWYGMFLGPFFMILLLVAVIAAVALASRWFAAPWHGQSSSHHPPFGRAPLDILKERYARGEIDKEEYEERRRVLGE